MLEEEGFFFLGGARGWRGGPITLTGGLMGETTGGVGTLGAEGLLLDITISGG